MPDLFGLPLYDPEANTWGPDYAHECDDVIPIHVARRPDATEALCGDRVLPRPAVPEVVELGAVRFPRFDKIRRPIDGTVIQLCEVEEEAIYIANLPRHREARKVADLCQGCLAKVAKLREKAARPPKKAVAKGEAAQRRIDRKAAAEAKRARLEAAKADRVAAAKAMRDAAWAARMEDDTDTAGEDEGY